MESYSYIRETFLSLTSKTYPHGTEAELVNEMIERGIFPELDTDEFGNYFYKLGNSRTVFASHLDTACYTQNEVKHIILDEQFVRTDGTTILGADDKAGVTIMLWMIKNNIPGLYYFFIGEEVGCVGSGLLSLSGSLKGHYDRVISFDRRGTGSVITFQNSVRTCSDEFAQMLSNQLNLRVNFNYRPDDTGVYTDSAEFVDSISECTNISVGYENEHKGKECQDLFHLNKLANAVLGVDWEYLPTKRNFSKRELKPVSYEKFLVKKVKEVFKKPNSNLGYKNRNNKPRVFYDKSGLIVL